MLLFKNLKGKTNMKLTSFIFVIAVFASACASAWTPSAAEVALSAREDARDLVLFKLLTR
jgi:hypothetical protein